MVEMSWRRIKEVLPVAIVVIIGVFQLVGNVQSVKFIGKNGWSSNIFLLLVNEWAHYLHSRSALEGCHIWF